MQLQAIPNINDSLSKDIFAIVHSIYGYRKTQPGPVKPSQHSLIAGLGRVIFALRPKIWPGPARCYLIPLSSDVSPLPAQIAAGPLMYRWQRVFEMPNS